MSKIIKREEICKHDLYYAGVTFLAEKFICQKCGAINKEEIEKIKKCDKKVCTDQTHFEMRNEI